MIAEHGLGRFTALAVAEQVGLTDAALFRHFASMDAIVLGAIDRVEELLFEGFPPEGADPLDRLGGFFRRRAAVIRMNPGIARLFASEELSHAASAEGVRGWARSGRARWASSATASPKPGGWAGSRRAWAPRSRRCWWWARSSPSPTPPRPAGRRGRSPRARLARARDAAPRAQGPPAERGPSSAASLRTTQCCEHEVT